MGATVAELQERMSSREFTAWGAYFAIEPETPQQAAVTRALAAHAAMFQQANRGKGQAAAKIQDFLLLRPMKTTSQPALPPEQRSAQYEAAFAALGWLDPDPPKTEA